MDFGIIESTEIQFEIYYGLISRLFLSPDESPFVAKSLRTLYQKMNEDDRKLALEGIKHIIKTNKAPNRKGQATEKTLSTKETTGLKELVRIMQENQSDEFIFDFLGRFFGHFSFTSPNTDFFTARISLWHKLSAAEIIYGRR